MAIFHLPPQVSTGGKQPYGNIEVVRSESAQRVDNPPFRYGGPVAVLAAIVALAQPNPWTYAIVGGVAGQQPYGARKLSPAIPGQSVDRPPTVSAGRKRALNAIIAASQPNPWVWTFNGSVAGRQPYGPKQLSPGVPGQSAGPPPFDRRRVETGAELIAANQPPTWPYVYTARLGQQPYGQNQLSPAVPGQSADPPPFDRRARENAAALVAASQPSAWPFTFVGAWQPYAAHPPVPGPGTNNPPFDRRRIETNAQLISFQQPDPWVYTFQGGHQPYAPSPLDPIFEAGPPEPIPGAGKKPGFPSYTPQPPDDAKPNKPFRPVWDKPKQGTVEEHPQQPAGPPPLPPAELFGTPGHAGNAKVNAPQLVLPDFNEFVPPDPMGLAKRMKSAQDMSDAMAVLQALGLLPKG